MKNIILWVIFLTSAIFAVGCSGSNAKIESKQGSGSPTDIEIAGPAFVLFFTEN